MRAVWIVALLGTAGTARADVPHLGDALDELLDPRSVAMGEAGRGMATGESSIALNPSGVAFNHELALEVDYGYRFSDDASIVNASACDSTNAIPGCFYYHYTGASPDSFGEKTHSGLHVFGATLAYPVTPNVSIGVGPKYYHFDTDDPAETGANATSLTLNNFALDAGATAHLGSMLSIGAAGYNLIGPSVEMPRALGGGVYVKPIQMLTLAFDSRWLIYDGDHSARFGGGANLLLSDSGGQYGFPLSAGVLHDDDSKVTYLSGGIGLTTMGYGLDVTARFAVSGPNDTEILASLRLWPVPRGNTQ
jgi:hypothetical protein